MGRTMSTTGQSPAHAERLQPPAERAADAHAGGRREQLRRGLLSGWRPIT